MLFLFNCIGVMPNKRTIKRKMKKSAERRKALALLEKKTSIILIRKHIKNLPEEIYLNIFHFVGARSAVRLGHPVANSLTTFKDNLVEHYFPIGIGLGKLNKLIDETDDPLKRYALQREATKIIQAVRYSSPGTANSRFPPLRDWWYWGKKMDAKKYDGEVPYELFYVAFGEYEGVRNGVRLGKLLASLLD